MNFNNVVDFHSLKKNNTIEFRCPNGTLNPIIWQNNVNLFAHLLSSDNLFQADLVNTRRLQNKHQNNNLESYEKETDIHKFTWQPSGSQFTIIEEIPEEKLHIKVKKPDLIDKEILLKTFYRL